MKQQLDEKEAHKMEDSLWQLFMYLTAELTSRIYKELKNNKKVIENKWLIQKNNGLET